MWNIVKHVDRDWLGKVTENGLIQDVLKMLCTDRT